MCIERRARRAKLLVWTLFCVLFGTPLTAHAFEITTTTDGVPVSWQPSSVLFETDPSLEGLPPEAVTTVSSAVQVWSGLSGAPALSVQPAPSASQPGFDGNNVIYFAPAGYPPAGNAIAVTILTYDDTTGHILDADIVLNGLYQFGILPAASTALPGAPMLANDGEGTAKGSEAIAGDFDIAHVVAHEAGHTLGLRDEMASRAPLMFLYTQPGNANPRSPTSDDLAGIAELYADASAGRACASSTMSPRHPRAGAWVWMGGAALLGVVLMRLRRKAAWRTTALAMAGAVVVVGAPWTPAPSSDGDARAKVVAVKSVEVDGPWRTEVSLSMVQCRVAACPNDATIIEWGGHRGNIVQEVGGAHPLRVGDEVELTLASCPQSSRGYSQPRTASRCGGWERRPETHGPGP
jgi:hypothetical protein